MLSAAHFLHPSCSPLSLHLQSPQQQSFASRQDRSKLQRTANTKLTELVSETAGPKSKSEWTESLRSEVKSSLFHEAISTYVAMTTAGIAPDNFAFPAILKAAVGTHDMNFGKQIHAQVIKYGYGSDITPVENTLVHVYGKCGDLDDVHKVFSRMSERDQVSWNSLIAALCRSEKWDLALNSFREMLADNVEPSSFTLVSVALACSNLPRLDGLRLGKEVHGFSWRKGDVKTYNVNSLIAMYSKLGKFDYAKGLFGVFEDRDLVTWNTLISSLAQNDRFFEALMVLKNMVAEGICPDGVTISSILPACSQLELLGWGKEIHAYVQRRDNLCSNSFVVSSLMDMYCNCKDITSAHQIFGGVTVKTIAHWNVMIAGYAQNGHYEKALRIFIEMLHLSKFMPNPTTISSVLPAFVHCQFSHGKEAMHGFVVKLGYQGDIYVKNALMDMYSRLGEVEISRTIFDSMEVRDIVSWNTMITGYVVCGLYIEALLLLHDMQREGSSKESEEGTQMPLKANSITLMTILPGCAALSCLAKGKEIHSYAMKNHIASDVPVGSALVDMYAKSGSLTLARRVFDQMPEKNVITWNVLIMAYGMHGHGEEALSLFKTMASEASRSGRVKPNEVTFISIFVACSHSGMVDQGLSLFYGMKDIFDIEPSSDHYACIVDLLGRSGLLEDAYKIINEMPLEFDKVGAWSSMLGACKLHKNVQLGEIVARNLFQAEPHVDSHYVLLSNIYSSAGLWEKALKVRENMKEMGIKKEPGYSWIEYGGKVYKFVAGDSSHPQAEKLYSFIDKLSEKMRKDGYVPDTSCVLHDIDDDKKENLLCGHSEKLAVAFGILNTPPGATVRVTKNLRICNDCHVAMKFISRIVGRDIVLRDMRRFHHFKDGICSCSDYW